MRPANLFRGQSTPAPRNSPVPLKAWDVWMRRGCAFVVAGVAAYVSYVHQREFALQGGADPASATLWPLSVDGLLVLATVGLLKPSRPAPRRTRSLVWLTFLLGIAVSLAANIAAAPSLAWKPVLVAGWPPVALLLSVELMTHRSRSLAAHDSWVEGSPTVHSGSTDGLQDPLLEPARREDLQHRALHQRPISAETLRKRLHVGAGKSRQLVTVLRSTHNGQPSVGEGNTDVGGTWERP